MIVTLTDARELGYCSRGLRAFFARHRLDWGQFLRQGLPAEALLDTGDAMAAALVEHVRRKHGRK